MLLQVFGLWSTTYQSRFFLMLLFQTYVPTRIVSQNELTVFYNNVQAGWPKFFDDTSV
jgi:hypothetical protein